jgi:hypothetical protein
MLKGADENNQGRVTNRLIPVIENVAQNGGLASTCPA